MPDLDRTALQDRVTQRELLTQAVNAALTKGEFKAALLQTTEAARRYESARDQEGQALTLYLLGKCYRRLNDLPASLAKHQESYELYTAIQDTVGSADALQAKAGTLRLMGRDDEAIHALNTCRTIYQQAGKRAQEMRTLMNLSILYKQAGDVAASQALLYECLAFFEQNDQVIDTAKVLLNIAANYNLLKNSTEAIRFARRGIPLFEAAGDLHHLSMALSVLGSSYLNLDDYEAALEQFRVALQIAEQVEIQWVIAIVLDDIGTVLLYQKRFDEAREVLERCGRINGSDGNRLVYCGSLERLGQLYAHPEYTGRDVAKALACLREAQQIAEEQGTVMLLVSIHKALAELHEQNGNFPQALESFRAFHDAEKQLFNEESDKRIKRLEIEKAQKDAEIAHLRMVELAQALTEAERLRSLAEEQARTDELTGVLNRRALDEHLREEFERSRRYERPFAVALVDIDYFKSINDSLGHEVGDNTLRHTAQLLRTHCRSGDRAARYGGEEFALLFPETELAAALTLCERLRESVAAQEWTAIHPGLSTVTISVGVSVLDQGNRDRFLAPSALLAEADHNLYQAKRGGKNQVIGKA